MRDIITSSRDLLSFDNFLRRVTYLCLGDVVYTGATRMMLDYFRAIGFPCPELENPLMYYRKYKFAGLFLSTSLCVKYFLASLLQSIYVSVCLSTVDRRSRERFIESNNQIASLVEKFKIEGAAYRKFAGLNSQPELAGGDVDQHQKIPLTAYGRPGTFSVFTNLVKCVLYR